MTQPAQPNPEATEKMVKRNIDTIAKVEKDFLQEQSQAVKIGHLIAEFGGTLSFALVNLAAFALWILVNSGILPIVTPFDPYPFNLLALILTLEAILFGIFILMSQNNLRIRDEQRMHLSLQLSLLIEQELTELLQMQKKGFERLNVLDEAEVKKTEELQEPVHVETVVKELENKIPQHGQ
jgi:uncharacterized membrane protein